MNRKKALGVAAFWLLATAAPAWAQVAPTMGEAVPAPDSAPAAAVEDDDGGRIVGGTPADPGTAPWQVEIYSTRGYSDDEIKADGLLPKGDPAKRYLGERQGYEIAHRCGGALIAENLVLTAAHCVANMPGSPGHPGNVLTDRRVQIGVMNLQRGGVTYAIDAVLIHRAYDRDRHLNDIALLRIVPDQVTLAPPAVAPCAIVKPGEAPPRVRVCAIRLHDRTSPLRPNELLRATGWGITGAIDDRGRATDFRLDRQGNVQHNPPMLMQVTLTPIAQNTCAQVAAYSGKLAPGMLCAGSGVPGRDTCQGDSGGPLTRYDPMKGRVLVGLVSWGVGCAMKGVPGIYTRVSEYRPWIDAASIEARTLKPGAWLK